MYFDIKVGVKILQISLIPSFCNILNIDMSREMVLNLGEGPFILALEHELLCSRFKKEERLEFLANKTFLNIL